MDSYLQCGRFRLALGGTGTRPLVMGILNVTPDSFSDGGRFNALDAALSHAEQMIADGVDIIDIGGESSRPGAAALPLQQELARVLPVVYALRDCGKPISVHTYKPEVMRDSVAAGADMINDINGFRANGALRAVSNSDCGLCIMHMLGEPATMQRNPEYGDVTAEVIAFLQARVADAEHEGIVRQRICIDPGFGFGKALDHNLALLRDLGKIAADLDLPLLAGMSRKSMLGGLTGKPVEQRMAGSIAAALAAAHNGAAIIRVHDVAETVDALTVWGAISQAKQETAA